MTAVPPSERAVVVLQPQFFPWRGVFEQLRLAHEFVHFDDTQFQTGGFTNRVKVKTDAGPQWITVPVLRGGSRPLITDTAIDYSTPWREKHLGTLRRAFAKTPFRESVLQLVEDLYGARPQTIAELDISAIERVAEELNLRPSFTRSSTTPVSSRKTERLIDVLRQRKATIYITGHGALDYLDEPMMERAGLDVRIMDYRRTPYPQPFGPFDPHMSILDLLANTGPDARMYLDSEAVPWANYLSVHAEGRSAPGDVQTFPKS